MYCTAHAYHNCLRYIFTRMVCVYGIPALGISVVNDIRASGFVRTEKRYNVDGS